MNAKQCRIHMLSSRAELKPIFLKGIYWNSVSQNKRNIELGAKGTGSKLTPGIKIMETKQQSFQSGPLDAIRVDYLPSPFT